MITPEKQKQFLDKICSKCQESKFWGEVILTYKNGNLVAARAIQTFSFDPVAGEQTLCMVSEEEKERK